MNDIQYQRMSLRAVVSYLDYRLKKDYEKQLFEIFVAEHLSIVASGRYTKEPNSYIEKVNKLWGKKEKKDERTAKQIIEDTFKKHGIKIKKKIGEQQI